MQRQRPRGVACIRLAAMLLTLLAASSGRADEPVVYRWIDAEGVSHYTTQRSRIPDEFEESVQEIRRATPTEASTVNAPAPRPPEASPADPPEAAPAPREAVPPPSVAAPPPEPPAPRVTPDGEFEESPLGAPGAKPSAEAPPSEPAPRAAIPPARDDVAAPPPEAAEEAATALAPPPDGPSQASPERAARPPSERPAPLEPLTPEASDALDQRIVALEGEIERDQQRLQGILSEKSSPDGPPLAEREDFREIAKRLPKLQADLKSLRAQRTRTTGL